MFQSINILTVYSNNTVSDPFTELLVFNREQFQNVKKLFEKNYRNSHQPIICLPG